MAYEGFDIIPSAQWLFLLEIVTKLIALSFILIEILGNLIGLIIHTVKIWSVAAKTAPAG